MTYCVVYINCLPLPRLFKKVTNHSPHGASHARYLFVMLYAIFLGKLHRFSKKNRTFAPKCQIHMNTEQVLGDAAYNPKAYSLVKAVARMADG